MEAPSLELPGLEVVLDRLDYLYGGEKVPRQTPHVFIYHLSIHNRSDRTVILLARKWIVLDDQGNRNVIEGDRIVGQTPHLQPGESFSYNSFHVTARNATAEGSFHGIDEDGERIRVRIPRFRMEVPTPFS